MQSWWHWAFMFDVVVVAHLKKQSPFDDYNNMLHVLWWLPIHQVEALPLMIWTHFEAAQWSRVEPSNQSVPLLYFHASTNMVMAVMAMMTMMPHDDVILTKMNCFYVMARRCRALCQRRVDRITKTQKYKRRRNRRQFFDIFLPQFLF